MSARKQIFETGDFYHIYNRAAAGIPIFNDPTDCQVFLDCAKYYRFKNVPAKFSVFRQDTKKYKILDAQRMVSVLAYTIMPNHFHFELRQDGDEGIQQYIKKVCNSFAHYYSLKYKEKGHVFQGNFKAAYIENDDQLLHISRYIHLNSTTSYLVEDPKKYAFSSFNNYLNVLKDDFIDADIILSLVGSRDRYEQFVLNQKKYQRKLKRMRDLLFD